MIRLFKLEGVEEACQAFESSLNYEMSDGLSLIGQIIAREAKAHHSFHNKTGETQRSITAERASGEFTSRKLKTEVTVNSKAAKFIEDKTQFLEKAAEAKDSEIVSVLESAIRKAAIQAGFHAE